jgi:hypothetical protein
LTRHVDVAPTLLDVVGIDQPESFRGGSLNTSAHAFAEVGSWIAVHDGKRKLVVNDGEGVVQLFAAEDTLDQRPLPRSGGGEERALFERLDWYKSIPTVDHAPHPVDWKVQQLKQLRALGYAE